MLREEKNDVVCCSCTFASDLGPELADLENSARRLGGGFEKHLQQDNRSEEDTIGSSGEESESA